MNTLQHELEKLILSIPDELLKFKLIDEEDEYSLFYALRYRIDSLKKEHS